MLRPYSGTFLESIEPCLGGLVKFHDHTTVLSSETSACERHCNSNLRNSSTLPPGPRCRYRSSIFSYNFHWMILKLIIVCSWTPVFCRHLYQWAIHRASNICVVTIIAADALLCLALFDRSPTGIAGTGFIGCDESAAPAFLGSSGGSSGLGHSSSSLVRSSCMSGDNALAWASVWHGA